MYVSDWMTTEVVTISEESTLLEARNAFHRNAFRHLPVLADGALVGVLTQTDLITAIAQLDATGDGTLSQQVRESRVGDHMSHPAVSVAPGETVETAALLMREHHLGALPVVDDDVLVGILTETNIFDGLIDALGLATGGARMVFDTQPGQAHRTVRDVMDQLERQGLQLTSIVTYRSEADAGTHLVVRARGNDS